MHFARRKTAFLLYSILLKTYAAIARSALGKWKFVQNPSQSYGTSLATRRRWTLLILTLGRQAGTWFTFPRGMEGWVDLGFGYIPRWFSCHR